MVGGSGPSGLIWLGGLNGLRALRDHPKFRFGFGAQHGLKSFSEIGGGVDGLIFDLFGRSSQFGSGFAGLDVDDVIPLRPIAHKALGNITARREYGFTGL